MHCSTSIQFLILTLSTLTFALPTIAPTTNSVSIQTTTTTSTGPTITTAPTLEEPELKPRRPYFFSFPPTPFSDIIAGAGYGYISYNRLIFSAPAYPARIPMSTSDVNAWGLNFFASATPSYPAPLSTAIACTWCEMFRASATDAGTRKAQATGTAGGAKAGETRTSGQDSGAGGVRTSGSGMVLGAAVFAVGLVL